MPLVQSACFGKQKVVFCCMFTFRIWLATLLILVIVPCMQAQDEDPYLDSLKALLPYSREVIPDNTLEVALKIRNENRSYAIQHRVYTPIVLGALELDQPEIAERYARELFPVFQLLRLNRQRLTRGIECRGICFYLSDYYYDKGNIVRSNYYRKLTLVRFVARFCGTGAKADDYRLMLQLIERYEEAGQMQKAKHWRQKAKRYHRRYLE